jgi:hypothetical protein
MKTLNSMVLKGSGVLLLSNELFAQTISWNSTTAVPLSPLSLGLLTGLFMLVGLWMLSKKHNQIASFFIVAIVATGFYTTGLKAMPAPLSIGTNQGTMHLSDGSNVVRNDYSETVMITEIDLQGCMSIATMGTACTEGLQLANGDSCNINIMCAN